ncbi:hypothetical protein FLAT13_02794 [Flavobacterium salmonis]|uniref:Uncharacterized protein n=1 Tax=Flavobacterium salmonis TaxID=2654844 RepID=A0A6V6Z146_9FLAO|nr:hypothetical protein FLAT13_02794 [Flavobacterium salmonis]
MYLHHKYDKKDLLKVSAFAIKPAILAGFIVYTPFHILFIQIFFLSQSRQLSGADLFIFRIFLYSLYIYIF